jgi:hypothetical protein
MVVTGKKVLTFSMVAQELSLSPPGEYRAASRAVQKSSNDPLRGRNVGQTMLPPIVILVLTVSPVLIPALVTAFHLVARLHNSNEFVTVVRRPITAMATDG